MSRLFLLLAVTLAPLSAQPRSAAEVDTALSQSAAEAPHLVYERAGTSPHGRPIPLIVASARPDELAQQLRVLVLAAQHGDEPTPTAAALRWLETDGSTAAPFEAVAVILLPLINPDGAAAGRRENGQGIDLNRDWRRQAAPETRLVHQIFERYQPHLVIDLHEFRALENGNRTEDDWIENHAIGRPELGAITPLLSRVVAVQRALGQPLRQVTTGRGAATNLAHRYFTARHRAAGILVEIGDGNAEMEARLLSALLTECEREAAHLKPALDRARGIRGWRPTPAEPESEPLPEIALVLPVSPPRPPLTWFAAGYLVLLVGGVKLRPKTDDRESEATGERRGRWAI